MYHTTLLIQHEHQFLGLTCRPIVMEHYDTRVSRENNINLQQAIRPFIVTK